MEMVKSKPRIRMFCFILLWFKRKKFGQSENKNVKNTFFRQGNNLILPDLYQLQMSAKAV